MRLVILALAVFLPKLKAEGQLPGLELGTRLLLCLISSFPTAPKAAAAEPGGGVRAALGVK